jgi:hypothetical protein
MSEISELSPEAVPPPRRGRTTALLTILLVLALAAGTAWVAQHASAMRAELSRLQGQLASAQEASAAKAAKIDAVLSPVALTYAKAAQARLKAGDKAGAKTELKRAQTFAVSLRDLGSGKPPADLVAALTNVEKALGQPATLEPPPMSGGT